MKLRKPSFAVILFGAVALVTLGVAVDLGWRGFRQFPAPPTWSLAGADAEQGRAAIARYGCGACHVVPGVRGARGRVGPQLTDFANQVYIAGQLPNVPENLAAWIRNPEEFRPGTAMPNLGVSEEEAENIAAYLYTLR